MTVGVATRNRRTLVAFIAASLIIGASAREAFSRQLADPPTKIEVAARAITAFDRRNPEQRRFGALEFRGGLELTSPYKHFGGLSAFRVASDGEHFISLSDKGRWFRGRIVYDEARPAAIAGAEMAPILGPDGRALFGRGWYDTESIAVDGALLYVGIERVNRIVRFDYGRYGLLARGQPVATPSGVASLPYNKGLEALAFVPRGMPLAGTLIAISERGLDANGNLKAFLIGGPSPGDFAVKRSDDYDISDCALLPSGDLLLLERKFSWTAGIAIRIRRIALSTIGPAVVVDGPALFEAGMMHQIDNMEGLSVHRSAAGELVLTMVSDDNFSILQRTLLLQFTLREP
jgi:hypothetical protein